MHDLMGFPRKWEICWECKWGHEAFGTESSCICQLNTLWLCKADIAWKNLCNWRIDGPKNIMPPATIVANFHSFSNIFLQLAETRQSFYIWLEPNTLSIYGIKKVKFHSEIIFVMFKMQVSYRMWHLGLWRVMTETFYSRPYVPSVVKITALVSPSSLKSHKSIQTNRNYKVTLAPFNLTSK